MIQLRNEHYEAISNDYRHRYHLDLLEMLRESFTENLSKRSDEELLARIEFAHTQSEKQGITDRPSIARYVALEVMMGPNIHERKEYRQYMTESTGTTSEKLKNLYHALGNGSPR